jgi:hypothetical protein
MTRRWLPALMAGDAWAMAAAHAFAEFVPLDELCGAAQVSRSWSRRCVSAAWRATENRG